MWQDVNKLNFMAVIKYQHEKGYTVEIILERNEGSILNWCYGL